MADMRWRTLVIAAGLALAIVLVRSGISNALLEKNPKLAVQISGGNGAALAALAQMNMLTAQSKSDSDGVRTMSIRALLASPLQASSLRNIGFIEDGKGHAVKAQQLISIGSRVSRRDAFAQSWLFDKYVRDGKAAEAVNAADIVMRQNLETWPTMVNALVGLSGDPRILKPIVVALAANPYWRGTYLQALGSDSASLSAAFRIFERLKTTPAPPRADELVPFFTRFDGSEAPARVWRYWQTLAPNPQRDKLIRDGGFEGVDAPPPFRWSLYQNDDVYSEIVQNPAGVGHALYLSYGAGRAPNFAHQMLALRPGNYSISVQSYAEESYPGPAPFALTLGCGSINTPVQFAALPIAVAAQKWVPSTVAFAVSPDCPVQQIWIGGKPLPGSGQATVWVDNVVLKPR